MSKASEWVATAEQARLIKEGVMKSPALENGNGMRTAWVTDSGEMETFTGRLSSKDACALARWILDTFEDKA